MRNYDYWKEQKLENNNRIILFLSGAFYRTFDFDSRFLSDKFGFKIKKVGGYEVVGFPKSVLSKYINEFKKEEIGYILYEKGEDNILKIIDNYNGKNKLNYSNDNLIYLDKKLENNDINIEKNDFKNFLNDLEKLIIKYR